MMESSTPALLKFECFQSRRRPRDDRSLASVSRIDCLARDSLRRKI
jgi:hypothetical protein